MATAIHAKQHDEHIVGIGDLRVVLIEEKAGLWFAQGLEIDYAAQGASQDDVQARFERGLTATISAHIKQYRSIDRLLVVTPDTWREYILGAATKRMRFSCLTAHKVPDEIGQALPEGLQFPFGEIKYLKQAIAA